MWALGERKHRTADDDENFTFLGKGVDFKGVVNFDGTVRIDGRLEGEIHTTGTLIVGEHAVIKGIVSAGVLVTSGKINGTVTAAEKVQILKPGILIGDVRTPVVSMEEGSHFHGMCDMGAHKWIEDQSPVQAVRDTNVHNIVAHRGKVRTQDL
ncbi:MAG TPA: polymer-forming cytoskeletal protein [Nitrospiraceae bacterium]|jgi:cytoskeletal protein CcmA (bactofilin family)|nr:polymer-forming cytoskeletal protein [Nitrospiraceae bacterium]